MSTKRKALNKIAQPASKKNAKKSMKTAINESETAVSTPGLSKAHDEDEEQVIEISSDSGSSEYDLSDEELQDAPEDAPAPQAKTTDGRPSSEDPAAVDGESDPEPAADTFGDLARANETIDVPSALSAPQSNSLTGPGRSLMPPASSSLGTVLTQALRTDDTDLLESCLHTTDINTINNTISRLDSTLAGVLLTKLASRMHRRPGRAGSLMTWVQWTLVAHGGALAMQPGVAKKLTELHKVLEERSRGLNSLLSLKGKLDLLDAQMQLRRKVRQNEGLGDDEEVEEGVVYLEGEESDVDMANAAADLDDDDDDALPVTNGIADDDEDEEDEEESSGDDEDEDELEGEDELDENDVNHDDVESEEDDSEVEAVPPAKRSRTAQFSKRR